MRVDRREGGLLMMDLADGQRILAVDPGGATDAAPTITVRPEWIKLASGEVGDRALPMVGGTVVDVVYLGSVTQMIVELPTGDRLTVHRLNDEVGSVDPRPGRPGDAALGGGAQLRHRRLWEHRRRRGRARPASRRRTQD